MSGVKFTSYIEAIAKRYRLASFEDLKSALAVVEAELDQMNKAHDRLAARVDQHESNMFKMEEHIEWLKRRGIVDK